MNCKTLALMPALLIIFLCLSAAPAQEVSATPAPESKPEVPAAKRALIREILEVTRAAQASVAMFTAQFDQMEKQMPDIQWQAISSMDEFKQLQPAQQEEVRQKVQESSARMSKRIKELFLERIDMKQMVEDISYAVYDKHFTEAELTDLVAFYKSPTGQKVVAEMPALFAESIARAGEAIAPKVKEIVAAAQQEQTSELTSQIDQLIKSNPKPPPKKPATTRRRH